MAEYDYITENDYDDAFNVYSQISISHFFKLDNISFNNLYSNDFINQNFKIMYKILDAYNDNGDNLEKKNKIIDIPDIIKICYDFKKNVLEDLFSSEITKYNRRKNKEILSGKLLRIVTSIK